MLGTTYGNYGSRTSTDNYDVGSPAVHGISDFSGVAAAIMAKKKADEDRRDELRRTQIAALTPQPQERSFNIQDEWLKNAHRTDEIEQLAAKRQPAPMTVTHPWGSAGFYTQNPDAMNAYQRQLYLPGGSSVSGWDKGTSAAQDLPEQGPQLEAQGGGQDLDKEALRVLQLKALMGRS